MKPNDIEMIYKMTFGKSEANLERVGELIRCKGCKWWNKEPTFPKDVYKRYCDITNLLVEAEDYCSYGESRRGKDDERG